MVTPTHGYPHPYLWLSLPMVTPTPTHGYPYPYPWLPLPHATGTVCWWHRCVHQEEWNCHGAQWLGGIPMRCHFGRHTPETVRVACRRVPKPFHSTFVIPVKVARNGGRRWAQQGGGVMMGYQQVRDLHSDSDTDMKKCGEPCVYSKCKLRHSESAPLETAPA